MFPARLSCLAESVQRHYSRNPGFGQKSPKMADFSSKSGYFWGTNIKFVWPYLEVVETNPGHALPKVAPVKWLSNDIIMFPARLSCLAESVQRHYSRNPGFGQK